MTIQEIAQRLNGMEYRSDIPMDIIQAAKEANIVIVYGLSDDLIEFEGAIEDEGGGAGDHLIDQGGLLPERDSIEDDDDLEGWFARKKTAKKIKSIWCAPDEPAWTYKTSIPHATFEITEDGEVYCRGIVFELASL